MSKKLSIIVPAYNERKTIGNLLSSFENQIVQNFQVICVDNGSSDSTVEIIKEYSKKSSYPLYLTQEARPGPGNARYKGCEFAIKHLIKCTSIEDHILATTDADCIALPNWTQVLEETFDNGCGIAGGAHTATPIIEQEILAHLGIANYFQTIALINEFLALSNIGKIKLSGPNSAIRLSAYIKAGKFTQPLNSDGSIGVKELTDLGIRVLKSGQSAAFIPCPIISSQRRHLKELIKNCDMYYPDKRDEARRFVSVRESETKLLGLALKTVDITRWRQYQTLLISKVIYNMLIKPIVDRELDLNNLKIFGLSDSNIQNYRYLLKTISYDSTAFSELSQFAPTLFNDLSIILTKIVMQKSFISKSMINLYLSKSMRS